LKANNEHRLVVEILLELLKANNEDILIVEILSKAIESKS